MVWFVDAGFGASLRHCCVVCLYSVSAAGRLWRQRTVFAPVSFCWNSISLHCQLVAWHAHYSVPSCFDKREDVKTFLPSKRGHAN